jgi:hypothetical protein
MTHSLVKLVLLGLFLAPIWMPYDYWQDVAIAASIVVVVGTVITLLMRIPVSPHKRQPFRVALPEPSLATVRPVVDVVLPPPADMQEELQQEIRPAAPPGSRRIEGHPEARYYHERYHGSWLFNRLALVFIVETVAVFLSILSTGAVARLVAGVVVVLGFFVAERARWKWVHWTREFNGLTGKATLYQPGSRLRLIASYGFPRITMSESEVDPDGTTFLRRGTLSISAPTAPYVSFGWMAYVLDAYRVREVFVYVKASGARREQKLIDIGQEQTVILLGIMQTLRAILAELKGETVAASEATHPVPGIGDTQEIPMARD